MNVIETLLDGMTRDAGIRQVVVGAFWTAVVLDSDPPRCGLASMLRGKSHDTGPPIAQAGRLEDHGALELAGWLRSASTEQASVGMAAYNALLEVDETACEEINAEEIILARGAGRRVAVVGHFPFVEPVRRVAAECWVLEHQPRMGDLPAGKAGEILPRADVVALTGTSLINHTFDDLIGCCHPEAYVVLVGASAPLSPLLFEHGVDAICGTRVQDIPAALQAIGQGATFRQIPGKRLLAMMRQYPRTNSGGG